MTPFVRQVLLWSLRLALFALLIALVRGQLHIWDEGMTGSRGREAPLFLAFGAALAIGATFGAGLLPKRPTRSDTIMEAAKRAHRARAAAGRRAGPTWQAVGAAVAVVFAVSAFVASIFALR